MKNHDESKKYHILSITMQTAYMRGQCVKNCL